ncbi:TM2 domain-containing protein [Paenibacillus thalictri]|uniref:TM2 domain-containing protein n=1 Tax=Paenibacillus thalictri TaxID=2527873 RepID=A0A4V2J390_9BACL|nr:TM2 domain-containing protein [Paenibacillus thalictri]TBL70544.1 TM2 domain-containing protein [Paenibacillus thalictri]
MDNLVARQGLTTDQQLMVNSEFEKKKKSKPIAFVLWFFLGGLGIHRFYLGDIGYAIGLIVVLIISWLTFFILFFLPIGIWLLVELFLISGRVDKINNNIELSIVNQIKSIS